MKLSTIAPTRTRWVLSTGVLYEVRYPLAGPEPCIAHLVPPHAVLDSYGVDGLDWVMTFWLRLT